MKKIFTFFIASLFAITTFAQDWLWTSSISGQNDVYVSQSVSDNADNLYVYGYFNNTINFAGNSYNTVGDKDIFLAKINRDGTEEWIRFGTSDQRDVPRYMTIDNEQNIYLLGETKGDCIFNGNTNKDTVFNKGNFDVFIAKYRTDGELVFAKNAAWGSSINRSMSITVDTVNSNILIGGSYKTECIFGIDDVNSTVNDTLNAIANKGMYVAKYDTLGNYISSFDFEMPNATGDGNVWGVKTYNNEYYIMGLYTDDVQLGTSLISTTSGNWDLFLYKTDINFTEQWVRKIYGGDWEYAYTLLVNQTGVNLAGYSASTDLTFESSTPTNIVLSGINLDAFNCKYDFNGDVVYAKAHIGGGNTKIFSGNYKEDKVLYTGFFTDSLIIGNDTLRSSGAGDNNAFWFAQDNNTGDVDIAVAINGNGDDECKSIYVDNSANIYISGNFKSEPLVFPSIYGDNDTLHNSVPGFYDLFIAKYGCRPDIYPTFTVDTITCPGSSDGSASVFITTNGTDTIADNWTYLWSNIDSDSLIENLIEDTYTVTITSPKGCQYIDSVLVTNYPILQTSLADTLTLNCEASNDGVAIVTPSLGYQGTIGYTYAWDTGESDSTATQLAIGVHYVTVQDACGTTTQVIDTINIGHIPTMEAHIQTQNVIVLCDTSSNGIGRVDYTDGKAPYSFYWENSNTDTTSVVANDLTVGWHHVTITDYCNVPQIDSVMVVNIPTIGSQITNMQNATCVGMNNGSVTVTTYNGIEPYAYAWSASTDTTATASDLPGDSLVYVTVSDICHEVVDSVVVGVNPELQISITNIQNAKCTTTKDGSAEVSLTNEQGTITYLWSNDSTTAINNALDTGYAYVTVTDMCGEKIDSAVINVNPEAIIGFTNIQNANCANSNDGTAQVFLFNDQGTITYQWATSANDTLDLNTNLAVGYNLVSVTDLCGEKVDSIEISSNPALQVSALAENNKCNSDTTGKITITTTNEFGNVVYIWANMSDTTSSIDSLLAGTYYYTVTDACNDTIKDSIVVTSPDAIKYSSIVTNASELGTNDGSAVLIVSGGTPTYSYDWSNGAISYENTNIMAGTYYYTITDANNCTKSDSVVVEADKYDIVIFNTFTPNGDGVNDVWNIKNIERFPNCKVKVFSQWGNQVFASDGYSDAWNGTKNNTGKELPAGTYYYTIDLGKDIPTKSGNVSIMK